LSKEKESEAQGSSLEGGRSKVSQGGEMPIKNKPFAHARGEKKRR